MFSDWVAASDRLAQTGLNPGGVNSLAGSANTGIKVLNQAGYAASTQNTRVFPDRDWRVRISLPPGSKFGYKQQYAQMLYQLKDKTNGVVFPYTPQVSVVHNARYSEQSLTHNNYKSYSYDGSDVSSITVTGQFTAQNNEEALYVMSCIYFLRGCTKMYFGSDTNAGTPPPIVRLSGYGAHYLPMVNCVVTQVSHTMPEEVDYVEYSYFGQTGRVPAVSTLSVTLQPVVSRARQAGNFELNRFTSGQYLSGSGDGGDIGGLL